MPIKRLPTDTFFIDPEPLFVDAFGLHPLFEKLAFQSNLILCGPKGIGKSLSLASFAAKQKCPLVIADCSEDMRRGNLIGTFVLEGNETPFVLGPLTTAFEIANEVGQCILCMEEINALTPQLQKILNPATDFRRRLEIPEAQRSFSLSPKAKLWIVGTMNTAVYGGVYALNEDLKSRFRILALGYPPKEKEKEILLAVLGPNWHEVEKLGHVLTLAAETRTTQMEYALSTRDLVQLLEDMRLVGEKDALRIVRGKFEESDRNTMDKRIMSVFGHDFSSHSSKKK